MKVPKTLKALAIAILGFLFLGLIISFVERSVVAKPSATQEAYHHAINMIAGDIQNFPREMSESVLEHWDPYSWDEVYLGLEGRNLLISGKLLRIAETNTMLKNRLAEVPKKGVLLIYEGDQEIVKQILDLNDSFQSSQGISNIVIVRGESVDSTFIAPDKETFLRDLEKLVESGVR